MEKLCIKKPNQQTSNAIQDYDTILQWLMQEEDSKGRQKAIMASCFINMFVMEHAKSILACNLTMGEIFSKKCISLSNLNRYDEIYVNVEGKTWVIKTFEGVFKDLWRVEKKRLQRLCQRKGTVYALASKKMNNTRTKRGCYTHFFVHRKDDSTSVSEVS